MMNFYKVCVNSSDGNVSWNFCSWFRNMKDAKRHGAKMKRQSENAHSYDIQRCTLNSKPNKEDILDFLNRVDSECC